MVVLIHPRTRKCLAEYVNKVVLTSEGPSQLQVFLDRPNEKVGTFRMRFASSRCKALTHD